MARRRYRNRYLYRERRGGLRALIVALLVVVVLGIAAWHMLHREQHAPPFTSTAIPTPPMATTVPSISADRVDSAYEGHQVEVSGMLRIGKPARDPQLGIEANALVLIRQVEMMQWHENCSASNCSYTLAWSERPVDSQAFRDAAHHRNPQHFPFASERFVTTDVHLGAFEVDPALIGDGVEATAYSVHASQLAPNMAATLRDCDGALCTTGSGGAGAVGDLRISYRTVPVGTRTLTALQSGSRLRSITAH
ncbi:MAG: TMEM43 family protein [Rhodanobacter sp.]|jgi:hypothetical protein|nr:TMEM43 family protein [Rhodanobacter sp.]